jgi:hypothetical protein
MPVQIYFETKEAATLLRSLRPKPDKREREREELRLAVQALRRPAAPPPRAAVPSAPPPSQIVSPPSETPAPPTVEIPPVSPPAKVADAPAPLLPTLTQERLTVPAEEAFRKTRKSKADDIVDTLGAFFSGAEGSSLNARESATAVNTAPLAAAKVEPPPVAPPSPPGESLVTKPDESQATEPDESPATKLDESPISLEPTPVVPMERIGDLRLSIRTSEKQQHAGVRTETCVGFFRRVLKPRPVETDGDRESPLGDAGSLTLSSAPLQAEVSPSPKSADAAGAHGEFFQSANLDANAPMASESSRTVVERGGKASVPAGVRTESTAGFFRRVVGGA